MFLTTYTIHNRSRHGVDFVVPVLALQHSDFGNLYDINWKKESNVINTIIVIRILYTGKNNSKHLLIIQYTYYGPNIIGFSISFFFFSRTSHINICERKEFAQLFP